MSSTYKESILNSILERMQFFCSCDTLPLHDELMNYIESTVNILENEDSIYRPRAKDGTVGGLIDFTAQKYNSLPVIIVPDLHSRSSFLVHLMKSDFLGTTVLDALNEGRVIVVCVGDGVHSESRAIKRWHDAYSEWLNGQYTGPNMKDEILEGIATMYGIMCLKKAFPEYFHFLKGNHENIFDNEGNGDHSFMKFAQEGSMVFDFMRMEYGDVILHLEHCFEYSLPICAVFDTFCVSHAEPNKAYTREQIINYHQNPDVILGLTWTANDCATEGSVSSTFYSVRDKNDGTQPLWFGGHRPVMGKFKVRQNGTYIQIHNPEEMNVAVLWPNKKFDPEEDIISIKK